MRKTDRVILIKIIEHMDDIFEFVENMSYDDFIQDKRTLKATCFSIAQIYELAFGTLQTSPTKRLSENIINLIDGYYWKGLSKTRSVLIHHYDKVNLDVLWGTINNSLPQMYKILDALIQNAETLQETNNNNPDEPVVWE
ncbi:MAG: DUF86 domain-containing protein [Oscillospiraceae bacterium]|nr:DUF86 domain-containing protein [Oscillospiraceae bacterium]